MFYCGKEVWRAAHQVSNIETQVTHIPSQLHTLPTSLTHSPSSHSQGVLKRELHTTDIYQQSEQYITADAPDRHIPCTGSARHRLTLQSTQLTRRSRTQTHTSWRYTQKHDADTYIMKIHAEAWCRHVPTHHKDTHRSTMQAHTCSP